MFTLTKNEDISSKKESEKEYRRLAHQTIYDGFLDTRVRLESYRRDVHVNLYNIAELSETPYSVSCIYTASNPAYWQKVMDLPMRSGNISLFPALGLMPSHALIAPKDWEKELRFHLTMNPKMLIGEIGLDLSEKASHMPLDAQKDLLKKQLKTARFWGRSVLLSAANAMPELLDVFKQSDTQLPSVMVLSAAQVPYQLLPELQNFPHVYYAFSPYVMDSRGYNERRVLHKTPLNRILLESRTGVSNCNSASLPYVANFIAKNLRLERKQIYAALLENSQRILGD